MKKKYLNNLIRVYLSLNERDAIEKYTNTPLSLIKNIDASIENAKTKRKAIKRIAVTLTVKDLDILIANIAERANQRNTLPEIQYTLDSLFGKLATKYNDNIAADTPLF